MDKDFLRFSFKLVVDPSLSEGKALLVGKTLYCHPSIYVGLMNAMPQYLDLLNLKDPEEALKDEIKDMII